MSVLDAIVLGVIQGLSEFLPISSSGHLVIAQELLGVEMAGVFLEVMLHFATLLSVVVVYRAKLMELIRGVFTRDPDGLAYVGLLFIASIPAGIAGLVLRGPIEASFDSPAVTGWMLLVTGCILFSTRFLHRPAPAVEPSAVDTAPSPLRERPRLWDAVLMGLAQSLALLPGISRAGTTIATGLWRKLQGDVAAEFSFLMSIIAVGGANLLELPQMSAGVETAGAVPVAAGFAAALISGIIAIKALVWLIRRQDFHRFAYYVWAVGGLYLIWLAAR